MSDVSKRETRQEKIQNRREARVGLASNVLGITAGTAALATASRNKAFRTGSVADAGPVTRRIASRSKGRIGPKGVGRLVRAGAAGAVALQAANLGGDLIANRVLAREAQQKVRKSDMSIRNDQSVSKGVFGHGETGHGTNLESVSKKKGSRAKCPNCEIPCDAEGKCPMCGKDCMPKGESKAHERGESKTHEAMEKSWQSTGMRDGVDTGRVMRRALRSGAVFGGGMGTGVIMAEHGLLSTKDAKKRLQRKSVKKAYRRFDSEADRQRRLGLYTGAGAGVAIAAGEATRRQLVPVKGGQPKENGKYVKGKRPIRGVMLREGVRPRNAAALAALAAGGALVSAASYKRGVSRRNQPWS